MDSTSAAMCGMSIMGLIERLLHQRERALGDVDRQVAHALQVGVDLERRDDEAQVGAPWAAAGPAG